MGTQPLGMFDPNLGYVPRGYYGQPPLGPYNSNYNPETGQQGPTGGTGANPYPQFRYQHSGPGQDPYGTPQDTLYRGYNPYYGNAIDAMAIDNRNLASTGGQQLQNDINNWTRYQTGRGANYEDQETSAWDPIAQGFGGYTDAQKEAILNNPALQRLQLNPDDAQSNYLTEGEQAGITGNPYGVMDYLGGRDQSLRDTDHMWGLQVGQGIEGQEANINGVLGGTSGALRGTYGQQRGDQQQNLSDIASLTRGAVDSGSGNVRGAVGQGVGDVRGAVGHGEQMGTSYIDPAKLSTSDDYMQHYRVDDRDMQNIRDRAGRQVGAQASLDEENLMSAANAQGNTNPLALATARDRIRRTGEINKSNAMTDAEIQARSLGLQTTQGRENTRLGAEQNLAGIGTGAALTLGGRELAAEQGLLGANLSAEQGLLGANLNNEQFMGDRTLGTFNQLGSQAQDAEKYLGSQALAGQQYLGGSRLSNLQDLAQRGVQTQEFTTGYGVPAYQSAETATSTRAGNVAGNRQGVNQYNQGQTYDRGKFVYGAGSAANTGFANNQQTQEQAYRDWLSGKQKQANENTTIGQQQRIGAYGSTNQGTQGATTGAIQNYAIPGAWKSIADTAIKAASILGKGGVEKGPHMALVGEAGPELIVDLDKLPKYGEGFGPTGSGESDEEEGSGWLQGNEVQGHKNPLYDRILRRVSPIYNRFKPDSSGDAEGIPDQSTDSSRRGGGGLLSMFGLAKGGIVPHAHVPHGPHPRSYDASPVELVDGPQIRMLGQHGAQAVVPLNHRKGNKVNLEDLPALARKFGR